MPDPQPRRGPSFARFATLYYPGILLLIGGAVSAAAEATYGGILAISGVALVATALVLAPRPPR